MGERLKLLENGKKRCNQLLSECPDSIALQSVAKQIEYLIALEQGESRDRSRLKDITIGVLTAREIESLDDAAAETFYQIASVLKGM